MPSDGVVGQCGQEPKNYSSTSKSGLFKPNFQLECLQTSQQSKGEGKKKTTMLGKGDAAAHQSGGDSLLHTCMGSHFELSK